MDPAQANTTVPRPPEGALKTRQIQVTTDNSSPYDGVLPPSPGILELNGKKDLLTLSRNDFKKMPSVKAWRDVLEISDKLIVATHENLRQSYQADPAKYDELVAAGYVLPKGALELMEIGPKQIKILNRGIETDIVAKSFFYLQTLTHPAILEARILTEQKGYQPIPGKKIEIFEELRNGHTASTYEDFGLKPIGAVPNDKCQESSSVTVTQGMFSWISKKKVGFPTMSNSMPSTNSAEALASLALLGTYAFVPTDGHLTTMASRLSLLKSAQDILTNHPIVQFHKYRDYELSNGRTVTTELQSRIGFIGVTLKSNPENIVSEASEFFEAGARVFRVYDAGSTNFMYPAVAKLREAFGDSITILVGQVTDVRQARILADLDVDAFVVGIGEGGICTTPVVGSLAPDNIMVTYDLCREDLGVPVICDGGVGRAAGVIFAMGASGSMASRRIIGGTIEQSPTLYWIKRNGHYEKIYAGEASALIKVLGGNVTMVGDPYNLEGINSYVELNDQYPSIPSLYSALLGGYTKALRFSRANSLLELQRRSEVTNIMKLSDGARESAGAHHSQKGVTLKKMQRKVTP